MTWGKLDNSFLPGSPGQVPPRGGKPPLLCRTRKKKVPRHGMNHAMVNFNDATTKIGDGVSPRFHFAIGQCVYVPPPCVGTGRQSASIKKGRRKPPLPPFSFMNNPVRNLVEKPVHSLRNASETAPFDPLARKTGMGSVPVHGDGIEGLSGPFGGPQDTGKSQ